MRPTLYANPGSTKQITSPIVGSGVCEDDVPVFNAGYFPNTTAYAIPQNQAAGPLKRVYWNNVTVGEISTVEFWAKADGWTWNGTNASDGNFHEFFSTDLATGGTTRGFTNLDLFEGSFMFTDIYPAGGNLRLSDATTTIDGNWNHWAVTTDFTLGANAMKIYKNGVVVAEGNILPTFIAVPKQFGITCGVPYADARTFGFKGWLSNIKVFDYAKTDFSDRFRRRSGMNDVTTVY